MPGGPRQVRRPRGNVLPIEGWIEPPRCCQCGRGDVVCVDLVECESPVRGLRQPGDEFIVDAEQRRLHPDRVVARFFRCGTCRHEWPAHPGTRFSEPGHSPP